MGELVYLESNGVCAETSTVNRPDAKLCPISRIQVIDFSEEGLQIELKCKNFFDFLEKPLFVRFNPVCLPVNIHWFRQMGDRLRCGCSFCESIDREPMIGSTLLRVSDELVEFLVKGQLGVIGPGPEMVFAFISIFYNLRLKFLEAVAGFHETKVFIQRFVNPKYHTRVDHTVRRFKYSKYYQVNESRKLARDACFNSIVQAFLQPYRELGCGILGAGEDMLFLENDVLNLLMDCLLMPDPLQLRLETMGDSVNEMYKLFLILRNRSPKTFQSHEFDRQFHYYSNLIGEIVLQRERLIDFLSGVGIEWK
jgi:hypothetical protein